MILFFQSKENKELINAINFILGYKTKKPDLFKLALLHKSIKSDESNEMIILSGLYDNFKKQYLEEQNIKPLNNNSIYFNTFKDKNERYFFKK